MLLKYLKHIDNDNNITSDIGNTTFNTNITVNANNNNITSDIDTTIDILLIILI